MKKSQTKAFLLLLFYIAKFIFCQKTYLEKSSLYWYICITIFSHWKCSNTNAHIDIHWFFRRHTSIQNTWQQTRYFNVDFYSNGLFLLFMHFKQVPLIQEKKSISIWEINFIIKSKRKGVEILVKHLFLFSILVFNMKRLVILFVRKKKAFAREYFQYISYK